jgi:hypothetical protein
MDVVEIIKESKKLSRSNKETLIYETIRDIRDFEEIEDAIDVLKSKDEKNISWSDAKNMLAMVGKI